MVRVRCLCVGLLLGLWMAGCARFPPTSDQAGVRRLVIEMQVAGRIRPEYTYFVLFNLSNDPTGQQGPVPVVRPPLGERLRSRCVHPLHALRRHLASRRVWALSR
jgi:hypothetical protein